MSAESSSWLNTMTLIGNTLKRGLAWHWRKSDQGTESNSYEGFIPVEDVRRRLFNFEAVEKPVFVQNINPDGSISYRVVEGKKAVIHGTDGNVFGVFSDRYQIHQYNEALLSNLEAIVSSSEIGIDSAGLLKKSGRAWVQISVPENLVTSTGFEFRPTILASSSHDGSLQTSYARVCQAVVCDNTLAMAHQEAGQKVSFRHYGKSMTGLESVRQALDVVFQTGEDLMAEIERLNAWAVTDNQFSELLKVTFPIVLDAQTLAQDNRSKGKMLPQREVMENMWRTDARVSPWRNTALGVIQATTTYAQHMSGTDKNRTNRNYGKLLSNKQAEADTITLAQLFEITSPKMATV